MMKQDQKSWGAALGVGAFATVVAAAVIALPQARAELIFDSEEAQQPQVVQAPAQTQRIEDRDMTRQTLQAAEKAHATVQAQSVVMPVQQVAAPQVVAAPVVAPAPVVIAQSAPEEVQNLSKSEMMRRERVRAELKNEDLLQERLEELRLRDEKRRTDHLLGAVPAGEAAPVAALPLKEEVVVAPLTERPLAQQQVQVQAVGPGTQVAVAPIPVEPLPESRTTMVSAGAFDASASERTVLYIQPRAGLASMNSVGYYDFRPHFSVGAGLGVGVSDNLSFELGYSFSEFGVALNNGYQNWAMGQGYGGAFETIAMKQNIAEAGLKLHFLGPDAKLRPFIGGGGAYARSFINYDQSLLARMDAYSRSLYGNDYDMSQFLGYLSTGFDIRVNKSISIGATFKYFTVLSARENQKLNDYAMYGAGAYPYGGYPYGGYPNGYAGYPYSGMSGADPQKQAVGGSVAKASFYAITGGVTFTF